MLIALGVHAMGCGGQVAGREMVKFDCTLKPGVYPLFTRPLLKDQNGKEIGERATMRLSEVRPWSHRREDGTERGLVDRPLADLSARFRSCY